MSKESDSRTRELWSQMTTPNLRAFIVTYTSDYHRFTEKANHCRRMIDILSDIVNERVANLPEKDKYPKNSNNIITGPMK